MISFFLQICLAYTSLLLMAAASINDFNNKGSNSLWLHAIPEYIGT